MYIILYYHIYNCIYAYIWYIVGQKVHTHVSAHIIEHKCLWQREYKHLISSSSSKVYKIQTVKEILIKPQHSSRVLIYYSHQYIQHWDNDHHLISSYYIPDKLLIMLLVVSPSRLTDKSINLALLSHFEDGITKCQKPEETAPKVSVVSAWVS